MEFKAILVGISPLIMHSSQLSDPLNSYAKELKAVSKKRQKTEEDLAIQRQIEWFGSLYIDPATKLPALPADNVLACIIAGARKTKQGKDAQAGMYSNVAHFELRYDGPKDLTELYNDGRFVDYRSVRVQAARVMRTRPRFDRWEASIALELIEDVVDHATVLAALETAGRQIGLGDFRPRYGRFEVTNVR